MNYLSRSTNPRSRLAALVLLPLLPGCRDATGTAGSLAPAVSSVYTNFKPDEEFARRGFIVDATVEGGRTSPRERYGWRPLQGSLVLPPEAAGCENVADAIRESLDRAVGEPCSEELDFDGPRERGRPRYAVFRYRKQGMRGQVFTWLFPDEMETRINYAILVHEELR